MTSARAMIEVIGGHGVLRDGALYIRVRVEDVRTRFFHFIGEHDRVDYLVTPVEGSGRQWVSADRVKLDDHS